MTIYENIKDICADAGISVSQLERDLGLERSNLYKWKDVDPGARKLKAVAGYFNVTTDRLLEGVPEWEWPKKDGDTD